MAQKMKSITVTNGWACHGQIAAITGDGADYRVEKVQNSTEFAPLQILTKRQLDELCEAKDWTVTVQPSKR